VVEESVRKLIAILFVIAFSLPAIAQWQRWNLSLEDQQRFDSYYSRWQQYRQRNDWEQITSMEKRMLDVYAHYNIPVQTPYWRVASNARSGRDQWRTKLSADDQRRFDSYYSRWQEYRQRNDRDQIRSMEKRMQDVYAHNHIPSGTPYFWVASNSRDEDWDNWEGGRWRGRLSNEDQGRFDSYYTRWLSYRRDNRRDDIASMERRMRDIMDHYEIPAQVPYDQIVSRETGY
jgi:hypothetical protein